MDKLKTFLLSIGAKPASENLFLLPNNAPVELVRPEPINGYAGRTNKLEAVEVFKLPTVLYDERPWAVEHWLKHKAGCSPKICYARECQLCEVPGAEARKFYDQYHLQGGTGARYHFGLRFGQRLVACLSFAEWKPSRNGILSKRHFNLIRFATAGNVPGAASRLFAHALEKTKAQEVVTFSDNSYAKGDIYENLGFEKNRRSERDYRVWHPKFGLRHKSYYQRRVLPTRLAEAGVRLEKPFNPNPEIDIRTEQDICRLMGCLHVWDSGKRLWIWRADKLA